MIRVWLSIESRHGGWVDVRRSPSEGPQSDERLRQPPSRCRTPYKNTIRYKSRRQQTPTYQAQSMWRYPTCLRAYSTALMTSSGFDCHVPAMEDVLDQQRSTRSIARMKRTKANEGDFGAGVELDSGGSHLNGSCSVLRGQGVRWEWCRDARTPSWPLYDAVGYGGAVRGGRCCSGPRGSLHMTGVLRSQNEPTRLRASPSKHLRIKNNGPVREAYDSNKGYVRVRGQAYIWALNYTTPR